MEREVRKCAECWSDYFADSSNMMELCPECSHYLYGYAACAHEMKSGRCTLCHWDGSSTPFIEGIKLGDARQPGLLI